MRHPYFNSLGPSVHKLPDGLYSFILSFFLFFKLYSTEIMFVFPRSSNIALLIAGFSQICRQFFEVNFGRFDISKTWTSCYVDLVSLNAQSTN